MRTRIEQKFSRIKFRNFGYILQGCPKLPENQNNRYFPFHSANFSWVYFRRCKLIAFIISVYVKKKKRECNAFVFKSVPVLNIHHTCYWSRDNISKISSWKLQTSIGGRGGGGLERKNLSKHDIRGTSRAWVCKSLVSSWSSGYTVTLMWTKQGNKQSPWNTYTFGISYWGKDNLSYLSRCIIFCLFLRPHMYQSHESHKSAI